MIEYTKEICEKMFNSIENPSWRIFKAIDKDGICTQNKSNISSPEKLFKFIQHTKPQKLYVSVSTFLSPTTNHGNLSNQKITQEDGHYFYPRAGFVVKDNLLIDSYFFVDIDDDDLDIAQEDTRKIINHMDTLRDYKLHSLQFSGSNGFHLIYKDLNMPKISNPTERIKVLKKRKGLLAKELIQLGLQTMDNNHINIMQDAYRVYAIPYSFKPNGNVVTPLDKEEFMTKEINHILRSRHLTRAERRRAIEGKPNDLKVASDEYKTSSQPYQGKERDGLISSSFYYEFMDNMVNGLKNNYVTVIKKHKKRFNLSTLKQLQQSYNLSDFYIVNIGNYVYAYNFKLLQYGRLLKVLRKAKSENLPFFCTRRHIPMQTSYSVNNNGSMRDKVFNIGILKSNHGLYHHHSRTHCKRFGLSYSHMSGKENNLMIMQVN